MSRNRLKDMAEAVYNQEHISEDMRLSSMKVLMGVKWGGKIPEGELEKVANEYSNLLRAGQIIGI